MKVGERIQIAKDQFGRPVWEFDREKREYITGRLQWFEVTSVRDNGVSLKPVWPRR